jgi:hypothetical protein
VVDDEQPDLDLTRSIQIGDITAEAILDFLVHEARISLQFRRESAAWMARINDRLGIVDPPVEAVLADFALLTNRLGGLADQLADTVAVLEVVETKLRIL